MPALRITADKEIVRVPFEFVDVEVFQPGIEHVELCTRFRRRMDVGMEAARVAEPEVIGREGDETEAGVSPGNLVATGQLGRHVIRVVYGAMAVHDDRERGAGGHHRDAHQAGCRVGRSVRAGRGIQHAVEVDVVGGRAPEGQEELHLGLAAKEVRADEVILRGGDCRGGDAGQEDKGLAHGRNGSDWVKGLTMWAKNMTNLPCRTEIGVPSNVYHRTYRHRGPVPGRQRSALYPPPERRAL